MTAYYNEFDPFAAEWLRNLIAAGHLPAGDVDTRSIEDVTADDVASYTQAHFFAGIGGWPLSLRLAGWPDSRPCWTGSCPCQPFSVASVGDEGPQGQRDERHLWPSFYRLIRERRPATVFGEQVPAAIGWGWWDQAALDLEQASYACGALVLRADASGASHRRQRLFWVADSDRTGREGHQPLKRIPVRPGASLSVDGNPLAGARRALDGDYSDLLPSDGVPITVERLRTRGYGNAIVPQVAAEFIGAFMEAA
jgi:DNA (cytosine-5)-methyltransferase 1